MNDFIFIYLPYKINEWFNLEFETEIHYCPIKVG